MLTYNQYMYPHSTQNKWKMVNIREAAISDTAAIETLYKILVPADPVSVRGERIAQIYDDNRSFLFVIEDENGVQGTAFVSLCLDPLYGFLPFAFVENVVVHPATRRRGYGSALIMYIQDFARSTKCSRIMIQSSCFRIEAHQFFEKMGFEANKKRAFVKFLQEHHEN